MYSLARATVTNYHSMDGLEEIISFVFLEADTFSRPRCQRAAFPWVVSPWLAGGHLPAVPSYRLFSVRGPSHGIFSFPYMDIVV